MKFWQLWLRSQLNFVQYAMPLWQMQQGGIFKSYKENNKIQQTQKFSLAAQFYLSVFYLTPR